MLPRSPLLRSLAPLLSLVQRLGRSLRSSGEKRSCLAYAPSLVATPKINNLLNSTPFPKPLFLISISQSVVAVSNLVSIQMKGRKGCSRWGEGSAMLIIFFDCKSSALPVGYVLSGAAPGHPACAASCVVRRALSRWALAGATLGTRIPACYSITTEQSRRSQYPKAAPRDGVNEIQLKKVTKNHHAQMRLSRPVNQPVCNST